MNEEDEDFEGQPEINQNPLIDDGDVQILMHRDAHFGGKFPFMIEYYRSGGKGIVADFDIEKIQKLADYEATGGQNLAAVILSGPDAEKIADSKAMYKSLRSIYETKNKNNKIAKLIADLILSEEEDPKEEIAAIVAEKSAVIPALIDLLRTEEFYDPLYPGYGTAPELAVKCLEAIGDKSAIISLFESIGQGDFFFDEQIFKALRAIGEPAKEFLMRVVASKPINEDNERAAIALVQFKDDPKVASSCFKLLKEPAFQKEEVIATYLALACEGLQDSKERNELAQLANDSSLSKNLRRDIQSIIHNKE